MPEATHQLAAIMFTDIVGYTLLMGESQEMHFSPQKELGNPEEDQHSGEAKSN